MHGPYNIKFKINFFTVAESLDSRRPVIITYWISSFSTYHTHTPSVENFEEPIEIHQKTNPHPAQCLQIMQFAQSVVITLCSYTQWKLSAMGDILHNSFQLFFLLTWMSMWVSTAVVTLENGGKLSDSDVKEKCNFLCLSPYTSFLPINTWQRGDEKSRIKTNEFRFRRANFIQRTSQVPPSVPPTTLNHYVCYYGLCHLFYNVNRDWMPACILRPIIISICRAEYQRTPYTETAVTYRYLEAYSTRTQPLVANQPWLLNYIITHLQIGNEDCTV
jgi:hypothetical protein